MNSILYFFSILFTICPLLINCGRLLKEHENCPYFNRYNHDQSAIPYSSSGNVQLVPNSIPSDDEENQNPGEEDEEYHDERMKGMASASNHMKSQTSRNITKLDASNNPKDSEISEYFLKAYFPELNDYYPGTPVGTQEYHITIQPNIKEIRNKLAKKITQTTNDFTNAIKTIRTMLNEETIEAVSSLITLPSTEFQFIKNVIKILKVTIENVLKCVSTAGSRLMSLPKRWSVSYQPCVVDEFKESWGIVENVHHIFQNAVYYIKNFIGKLETCFSHEESLIQWCINDIFNDVPSYVKDTVSKLNRELDSGIFYLKGVPTRVDKCQMSDNSEKKLLLPFMIIREMVKCVLSKAEI